MTPSYQQDSSTVEPAKPPPPPQLSLSLLIGRTAMASGLFALLDDIAVLAKAAAASLDDVTVQALKAGKKAAAIVIDDAAVTPRYVVGFAAEREFPIIAAIAWRSLKNKTIYLLPGALLLSFLAPWAITPLLMLGGAYLAFEGYEKLHALLAKSVVPENVQIEPDTKSATAPQPMTPTDEEAKIASAVRTDFILSAEIMAITLTVVTTPSIVMKASVLGLVGLGVTVAVYGLVALIVKADDVGIFLAQRGRLAVTRAIGLGLVAGMPAFLSALSIIGMLAMLWVSGGIILHGLEEYGLGALPHAIHDAAKAVGGVFGPLSGAATWIFDAAAAGVIGLAIGWLAALVAAPLLKH